MASDIDKNCEIVPLNYALVTMNTIRISLLAMLIISLPTLIGIRNLSAQEQTRSIQQLLETAQTKYGKEAVPFVVEAQRICQKENCGPQLKGEIYHELSVAYFQGYIFLQ